MNKQEPAEAMEEREDILQRLVREHDEMNEAFVPYYGKKIEGKTRLVIDFPDPQAAVKWLADAQGCWLLPTDVTLYQRDALDDDVKASNVFIIKRKGHRPDTLMLHIRTISEEGV